MDSVQVISTYNVKYIRRCDVMDQTWAIKNGRLPAISKMYMIAKCKSNYSMQIGEILLLVLPTFFVQIVCTDPSPL